MATRVNTRFVVLLTVGLVVCAGVVGAFAFKLYNTGADLARAGDKQMAAGKYKEAGDLYSKAVNKEKTNLAFVRKWKESLSKQTPDTQTKYINTYQNMIGAMRQLAVVDKDNADVQREYLEIEKQAEDGSPFQRASMESYIRDADLLIDSHAGGPGAERLKRYRGLARLRLAIEASDSSPDDLDKAKADLDAALAADPADTEVVRALERYYLYKAAKADAASKPDEAAELNAKGGEVVSAFLAKNPTDATMMLASMRREVDDLGRSLSKRTDRLDLKKISDEFREKTKPKLDAAANAAMTMPPGKIDLNLLGSLRQMEMTIDPAARQSRTEALARVAIAASPDNANFISFLAEVLESRDNHTDAIAQLQKIVEMPAKPVSLAGAELFQRKTDAIFRQGLWTIRQWQAATTGPDRDAAADRARAYRTKLAGLQEATSLGLMLLDADLAFVDGDYRKANRLLDQFNSASHNASVDALMLGAEVALRLNEPGSARQRLESLLSLQSTNLRAIYILAGIEMQLQNYDRAAKLYSAILEVSPDNPQAKEGLRMASIMTGRGGKIADPVLAELLEAEAVAKDPMPDPQVLAATITKLREQMKTLPSDVRLWHMLATLEYRSNDREAALAAVNSGLAAFPDSKDLQAFKISLSGTDPLKTRLELIDAQQWSPLQKDIEKYTTLRGYGKIPEAKAMLDDAKKLAPDDPAVLELVFMVALEDKQFDLAKTMCERAQKEDLDKAGGDTYRARLESAQGNNKEALRIMEEMVKRGGAQPESWRLKGRLENLVGHSSDAVASFRKALELRPNDIPTIKDLLNTQVGMRQAEDALATARKYMQFAQGDPDFVNVWLTLEGGIGNRAMVVLRREQIARQNPNDRDNNMALSALYMDLNRRADARPLIDAVRSKADGLDSMELDAGWYWAERKPDQAKDIFEKYIAAIDKTKLTIQPFLVYAQFLLQRQDAAGAMAVLERAREFQHKDVAEADKAIADTYLATGQEEEAIKVCQRIIDAHADTAQQTYFKRMVEAMIAKKHYSEAEALIKPLLTGNQPDAVLLLLASDCRNGLNDRRGQLQLLDRAVAQFPGDPMVFVKRGQALMSEPDRLHDSVEDFTLALQLNPEMAIALRLRAAAYDQLKDQDKSIADLRAALLINPSDDALLGNLIAYLIRNNRDSDAAEIARQIMDKREGDALGRLGVGEIFASVKKWDIAAQFMSMAFELDHQDGIAQRYLDCLLSAPQPNLIEVERVLTKVFGPQRVAASPSFLMAQARLQMKQNKSALAGRSASDALHLIKPENARDMMAWFNESQRLQPDPKLLAGFYDGLIQEGGPATEWLAYFRANLMLADPAAQPVGMDQLGALLKTSKTPILRQLSYRALAGTLYNLKRFEDAAAAMRASVQEFPNDPEALNNLAYTLAKDLNKPTEAATYIEQAVKLKPDSAEVLDTQGLVQLLNGKADESLATLIKAQALPVSPAAAATIHIHLTEALWAVNKKDDARRALEQCTAMVDQLGAGASDQTKTDLEQLRKKISAP